MTTYRKARRVITSAVIAIGIILAGGALGYSGAHYGFGQAAKKDSAPVQPQPLPQSLQSCLAAANRLSVDEKIGQLIMVGISNGVATDDDIVFIKTNHVGGAVYLGKNDGGTQAAAELSARLQSMAKIPMLIAADQEGGNVQRLTGPGFDTIPTASAQALLAAADLQNEWHGWGGQLHAGGINYNLAPVADLVQPNFANKNAPIGMLERNYGTDEQILASSVRAAISGMRQAGVATAAKHFPGLGAVRQNTDYGTANDDETTADSAAVRVFQQALKDGGADSVMVSLATYTKLDPNNQAVFSKAIVNDLLRGTLQWQGVVVSDDLGAAAAVSAVPAAERGVKFLVAGGDLIIAADAVSAQSIIDGIKSQANSDTGFAVELNTHAARVLKMKSRIGLTAACQ